MRQQALSFCRKLARAVYIRNYWNEWLPQIDPETQERLTVIRTQVETVIDDVKKEASKYQLRCERVQLLTVGADNIPITWHTFQLTSPFNFRVDKLLSLVKKFAEFLKTDFPRVPFKTKRDVFIKMGGLGKKLVNLHLLKSELLSHPSQSFREKEITS